MFTKEERLFIWKKVYEMIDWQEDGTGRFGAFIQRHLHGKGRRIISSCPG